MKSLSFLRKKLGVTAQTLRNYIKQGKISAVKAPNGRFYVEDSELEKYLEEFNTDFYKKSAFDKKEKIWAYYIRSSDGNKNLLESQKKLLKENFPTPTSDKFIFQDSASGLNENRKGLQALINKAKKREITDIAITTEDRLSRFGNKYLIELFMAYGVTIHFLNSNQKKEIDKNFFHEELLKDFMALFASFSGRYYRIRSLENQQKFLNVIKEKITK